MENEQWSFVIQVAGALKYDFVGNVHTDLGLCAEVLKVPSNWTWFVNGKATKDLNYVPKRGDYIGINRPVRAICGIQEDKVRG